jgi:hypothetical protein
MNKLDLFLMARDHWLKATTTKLAYERSFLRRDFLSNSLKILSVVAALLTAASSILQHFQVATGVAIITAIVTVVERLYAPSSESQKFWHCCNQLEGVQRELAEAVYAIENAKGHPNDAALRELGKRITEVTKTPFRIDAEDKKKASQEFLQSLIYVFIRRYEGTPEPEDDLADLAADAPGVVQVMRSKTL